MSQQYPHDPNQPFRPYPPQQPHPPQQAYSPQQPAQRPAAQKQPTSRSAKIGWAVLSGLILFALGAVAGNAGAGNAGAGNQSTAAAGSPAPTATVTVPGEAAEVTAPPATVTVTAPPAKPATKPTIAPKPTTAPKTTTAPKAAKITYKKLTARQWAKIAKSPDDHIGEGYVVYGKVTQFDAATGEDAFRADVDGVKHKVSYGFVDYPTNTVLTNLSADVSDLVEDDLFQANVQVLGSLSYDTQIGGETTVPNLSVISLKVIGSVK